MCAAARARPGPLHRATCVCLLAALQVVIAGSVLLGALTSALVWLMNKNRWWHARFGHSMSFFDMVTGTRAPAQARGPCVVVAAQSHAGRAGADRVHSRAVSWLLVAVALVLAAQVSLGSDLFKWPYAPIYGCVAAVRFRPNAEGLFVATTGASGVSPRLLVSSTDVAGVGVGNCTLTVYYKSCGVVHSSTAISDTSGYAAVGGMHFPYAFLV